VWALCQTFLARRKRRAALLAKGHGDAVVERSRDDDWPFNAASHCEEEALWAGAAAFFGTVLGAGAFELLDVEGLAEIALGLVVGLFTAWRGVLEGAAGVRERAGERVSRPGRTGTRADRPAGLPLEPTLPAHPSHWRYKECYDDGQFEANVVKRNSRWGNWYPQMLSPSRCYAR
jgi:hypothetical protein